MPAVAAVKHKAPAQHPFETAKNAAELKEMQDAVAMAISSPAISLGKPEPEPEPEPVDDSPAGQVAQLKAEKARLEDELKYQKFVEQEKRSKPHSNYIPGYETIKKKRKWDAYLKELTEDGITNEQDLINRGLYLVTRHNAAHARTLRLSNDDTTGLPL